MSLGFSMAWYIVLPVVFLPAYFGIEIEGTVMGYIGADYNKDVLVSYEEALKGRDITEGIHSITGGIRGLASVQLSFGVGLCGTLGVRLAGKVDFIVNWGPTDPHGSWGLLYRAFGRTDHRPVPVLHTAHVQVGGLAHGLL